MLRRLKYQQLIHASQNEVWEYFATPQNLNDLTPPDMKFQIVHGGEEAMYQGQLIEYRIQFMPFFKSRWLTEITRVNKPAYFIDEQRIGPYLIWHHEHHFLKTPSGVEMTDLLTYQMPFGPLGDLLHILWIGPRLRSIFNFRASQIEKIFSS